MNWKAMADKAKQTFQQRGGSKAAKEDADGEIEAAVAPLGFVDDDAPEEPDREPDGDVHEHDPPPRDELGEQPTGDQTDSAASGGHGRVEPHRAVTFRPVGEDGGEQGQG